MLLKRKAPSRMFFPGRLSAVLVGLFGVILFWAEIGCVESSECAPMRLDRPRVGLALSGGGARGAAHIGVLRVLEELRVPVDCIAGTSMGAIIGGLYASGMPIDEIERTVTAIDWDQAFADATPRGDLAYHRKLEDRLFLVKSRPGFEDGKVKLPAGLIEGQKIELIFRALTLPVVDVKDFDCLRIPYRAVAADIATGEAVVLGSGDLATAMRASMSIPGVFSPIEVGGRLLVDGGVSNNLPVDVARSMGADVVIAVDISTPLSRRKELTSVLSFTVQLTRLLTRRSTEEQIASLKEQDLLFVPDLKEVTTSSFELAGEAVSRGAAAAREKKGLLARLSLSPEEYAVHRSGQKAFVKTAPAIRFVRIENHSRLSDEVIRSQLNVKIGEPLETASLEADIGRIYGLDYFEKVSYEVVEEAGQTGLVVRATEKAWGPNYLEFGLRLDNNFKGDNSFELAVGYRRTAVNRWGGEWRTLVEIGGEPGIFTRFYQPLSAASPYFVAPVLFWDGMQIGVYEQDQRIAEYYADVYGFALELGREFGTWGAITGGVQRYTGDIEVLTGSPAPKSDFDGAEFFFRLSADKLDSLFFPREGAYASLGWNASREALGSDVSFDQLELDAVLPKTWGRHTFIAAFSCYTTLEGDAPLQNVFRLGGLFNLSGFNQDQLSGQQLALARIVYFRRIGDFNLLPAYFGGSLELGNVWQDKNDIGFSDAIWAGSLYVGVDTQLGPVYLGFGHAEGGNDSLYLYLGRWF